MGKALFTLATIVAEFGDNSVAEFGDYSRQCGQGLKHRKACLVSGNVRNRGITTIYWYIHLNMADNIITINNK